jgi:N-acetylglutamate synthase-like GNAT family acetyltransferase
LTKITISGSEIEIRHAIADEIAAVKMLLDRHKNELGFVIRSALVNSIERNELIVTVTGEGEIVGVVHYRHRRDGQTTLYSIVVDSAYRLRGIGNALLCALKHEAVSKGQTSILLKCPTELEANKFYEAEHFSLVSTEPGKHRPLNIWRLPL